MGWVLHEEDSPALITEQQEPGEPCPQSTCWIISIEMDPWPRSERKTNWVQLNPSRSSVCPTQIPANSFPVGTIHTNLVGVVRTQPQCLVRIQERKTADPSGQGVGAEEFPEISLEPISSIPFQSPPCFFIYSFFPFIHLGLQYLFVCFLSFLPFPSPSLP